ncbi:unnamed protein product [Notodromas monacha]|uniref:Uncharacterized protein n=1 Tax=Notodromas monacha TaxID=399045 RepID=A0A7R9BW47_9CRUS|nr:unnamed protein product [Notodromas monacha]CAG0922485.1 unnamed protein product [Notodromas monacha]
MEQTNQLLKAQLQELDRITQQYKIIQLQLEEKNEECENLTLRLKAKSELCQDLENQLARVIDKNTELTIQNSDLQRQIQELQRLSQECDSLRKSLSNTEAEYDSAQEEVEKLRSKISHLETVLQKMREAAETRRDLETEHAETIQQLKEKREEISRLARASDLERDRNAAAVDRLQAKVFELEKRTLLQNAKQEELAKELEAARRRRAPDIHDQNGNFRNLQAPLLQLDTSVGGDRFGLLENGRSQRIVSKPSPDSGIGSPEALKESFAGITLSANGTAGLSFVTPTDHGVLMRKQNGHVANGALGVTNNRQGLDTAVPSQLVMAALEQHRGLLQHQAMSQLHTHVARPATVISPVLGTDFMDVPGRGRCSVFIARYSYDPFMQSPNDNPESELPLTAGDYVLVWGDVDEIVTVDALFVPAPRMLVVERQLSNSVLIAWAAPAATDSRSVDCYRVFVDGDLQLTIGANERLKALLEGIDPARAFGTNEIPPKKGKNLFKLCLEALNDFTLRILMGAALVSIALSIYTTMKANGPDGEESTNPEMIEGIAIIVTVLIVVMVSAFTNFNRDRKFRKLQGLVNKQSKFLTSRDGKLAEIPNTEIVVGDVCVIKYGDILPADGIVLESIDLKLDESSLTGESDRINKTLKKDIRLLSGTDIVEGKVLTFLVLIIKFSVQNYAMNGAGFDLRHMEQFISFFITGVTILVVAVPEGLPLAVTLALAYSVIHMTKDNNLVRHLNACETMGNATAICSDKTGTLTTNRMEVVAIYVESNFIAPIKGKVSNKISKSVRKLLVDSIALNSSYTSMIVPSEIPGGPPSFMGNMTECALLGLVKELG